MNRRSAVVNVVHLFFQKCGVVYFFGFVAILPNLEILDLLVVFTGIAKQIEQSFTAALRNLISSIYNRFACVLLEIA